MTEEKEIHIAVYRDGKELVAGNDMMGAMGSYAHAVQNMMQNPVDGKQTVEIIITEGEQKKFVRITRESGDVE